MPCPFLTGLALVVDDRKVDLLTVVLATHAGRGLASLLHGREQPDQHCDNGDDDEQFDQRERAARRGRKNMRTALREIKCRQAQDRLAFVGKQGVLLL